MYQFCIILQARQAVNLHSADNPPHDRGALVVCEIVAGAGTKEMKNAAHLVIGAVSPQGPQHLLVARNLSDPFGQPCNGGDEIGCACCDCAVGHRREFGFSRVLHEDQTATFLDGASTQRTVRSGPAQDDCHSIAARRGDRPEEHVNRGAPAARFAERARRYVVTVDHQFPVRCDDVDTIRLEDRIVVNLIDGHCRIEREDLAHRARVVRREMHDDHESNAQIVRNLGKERAQRCHTAG